MKVSEKIKSEVLQVYDTWLQGYLNGDVPTYDAYFDDTFHFIGSTNNEEFLNRTETTQFFTNTADQLAGKCDLRKETKIVEKHEGIVFITHLFDAWFKVENDFVYYGRFRFTNTLKETNEGWRFIYQHFSTTDSRTEEGETIGFDRAHAENQALREVIKRNTFQLEEKNRELQIEAALERMRSQSMMMQQSQDLKTTSHVFHEQLLQLGIPSEFSYVWLPNEGEMTHQFWATWSETNKPKKGKEKPQSITQSASFTYPLDKSEPYTAACFKMWESDEDVFVNHIPPEEVKPFFATWAELLSEAENLKAKNFKDGLYYAEAYMKFGCFGINIRRPLDENEKDMLHRVAKEFERTYIRFLDLQKAEAQAREAQVEAALERVRSQSMAMHKSEDLADLSVELVKQVQHLDIETWFCAFNITTNDGGIEWGSNGQGVFPRYETPREGIFLEYYNAAQRGEELFVKEFDEKECPAHYEYLCTLPGVGEQLLQMKKDGIPFPTSQIDHVAFFKYGYIIFITYSPVPEAHDIFKRFANVFEQSYTRFLDLKKAEAQAREAQIEASLEKVRSVALSLQKPDDMLDIAKILYEQLLELGFSDIRNAIIDIHNDDDETFLDYDYSHDMSSAITQFSFYGDPVIEQQIKKVQSGNDAFFEIELKGDQLKELIETRRKNGEKDDPRLHTTDHLTYNLYSFGNGAIGISNFGVLTDNQKKILKRFRNVFTFAYKRYTDLTKAAAQAREAKIEAALEKVRSVALSMDESKDLLHIAKELYEQLLELGFDDIRNALIDVNNEDAQTFLDYDYSHEMGGTITLMSYDDDPTLEEQLQVIANTTDGFSEMALEGQQLQDLIEMRRKNGEAEDPRLLKADSVSYILYAFGNGAIGISNFGALTKDQKNILDRFRNVFTFAYQRFSDLLIKEEQSAALLAEKRQLEKTLTDLQETQKQLIQSEKMASLGELTAGIAHEIQNPLNFVNNFSEVSNELIEEVDEEIGKGDLEEVKLLLTDIKQNLLKINHHGKRADAIVKGMLQHSRSSTVEKEPTDINKLTDEYFRLAYHGLRAKDKSFNATIETDFDDGIGMAMVIPQDIGRVILNLITNAFYAVNEKKSEAKEGSYEPKVSVSTHKEEKHIAIKVKDNGNGIPKGILDKIFQPFFTTKPTGKGTGLGLSMSYDVVTKGHGGDLTVETKKGIGTTFIIRLPKKT